MTLVPDADRARLLERMMVIVRDAGTQIMRVYGGPVSATLKADQSPLTDADLAAHRTIVAGLHELTPRLPVISEEGGLADFAERSQWDACWLVDPLDGTKEFLARNGEFTVNLALVEGGRPTLGVVGVPAREQLFVGDVRRQLAQRIDADGRRDLRTRAYRGGAPVIVASRRHGGEELERVIKTMEQTLGPLELRNVGSALKLCILAEGTADLYPRLAPTSEWDTAAAHAVLEASGGAVLQLGGAPLVYNKPDILNPRFVAVGDPRADWLRWFHPGSAPV